VGFKFRCKVNCTNLTGFHLEWVKNKFSWFLFIWPRDFEPATSLRFELCWLLGLHRCSLCFAFCIRHHRHHHQIRDCTPLPPVQSSVSSIWALPFGRNRSSPNTNDRFASCSCSCRRQIDFYECFGVAWTGRKPYRSTAF